jgi:hypothetical protein
MPQNLKPARQWPWAVAAALLLAASGALAQSADKPRTGSFGKGKSTGPLLTRTELRECLKLQPRMRAFADEVVAAQVALDKHKAEIAQLVATLNDDLATLDRTNEQAVDEYNKRVLQHGQRVDDYNALTPAFNVKVENLQAQRAAFAKNCEGRDFDERDEVAIRKEQ